MEKEKRDMLNDIVSRMQEQYCGYTRYNTLDIFETYMPWLAEKREKERL